MGRLIILIGGCLIVVGALMTLNISFDWIGHLPGDFLVRWRGMTLYIPLTTSLLFSLILSLLLYFF